ncbi:hypothetical protein, partial [Mycobacterium tuberculosis]
MLKDYKFFRNKVVLPISPDDSNKTIFIKLTASGSQIGIKSAIELGEYDQLQQAKLNDELPDVVLGSALVFLSLFSVITIIFINRFILKEWYAFCIVMFSIGVMILSYSTFFHSTYKQFGELIYHSFDYASNLLLPALFYFFEKVFGAGPKKMVSRFKYMHYYLSGFYIVSKTIGFFFPSFNGIYESIGVLL